MIFYLKGDIHTGGSAEIKHDCSAPLTCKPTDFQIYAYGSIHDSHQVNGVQASHICMHGSGATYGFILAPQYTMGVAGAGGTAGFIGSAWAKQWNPPGSAGISGCDSNTSSTAVTQTDNWTDLESALLFYNIPPKLGPISSWQRQEASP